MVYSGRSLKTFRKGKVETYEEENDSSFTVGGDGNEPSGMREFDDREYRNSR